MTEAELCAALKTLGMPVAYGSFAEPTAPPFITYQFANDADLKADNQNYVEISNFQVELYTSKKDPAKEKLIRDKLNELRLPHSKVEAFLTPEKLIQVIYEIQII